MLRILSLLAACLLTPHAWAQATFHGNVTRSGVYPGAAFHTRMNVSCVKSSASVRSPSMR